MPSVEQGTLLKIIAGIMNYPLKWLIFMGITAMSIKEQEILDVAKLANIHIGDDELACFVSDLSAILDFVKQIQTVNTDNVTPMASPLNNSQHLRTDKVTERDCREQAEKLSSHVESHLYKVPKVIESI